MVNLSCRVRVKIRNLVYKVKTKIYLKYTKLLFQAQNALAKLNVNHFHTQHDSFKLKCPILKWWFSEEKINKANGFTNNRPICLLYSRNGTKDTLSKPCRSRFTDSTDATNFIGQYLC